MKPNCQAIHKRLARFTAKRPAILPGDGCCLRQVSVYTEATGRIKALRCIRNLKHSPPCRFRHPSGHVSEVNFKKKRLGN